MNFCCSTIGDQRKPVVELYKNMQKTRSIKRIAAKAHQIKTPAMLSQMLAFSCICVKKYTVYLL